MSSRHPYYRDQLSFLREGGLAMAKAHPRDADLLARALDDPDVERMLEGIAFFVGKITQKQVNNLSHLCQFLFDILFPHYLCPSPATAVVEFAAGKWPEQIPRDTTIKSVPVRGTACTFRTTYEVDSGPLTVRSATWNRTASGGQLALDFKDAVAQLENGVPEKDRIRLHLHGDPKNNATLFHWLFTHLDSVQLVDGSGQPLRLEKSLTLHPLGYTEEEALFPYPLGSFPGFRLLQEYFILPAKFLFFEVRGAWAALASPSAAGKDVDNFGLRFNLKLDRSRSMTVGTQNVRLGCTPVINLFPHQADPIMRHPGKAEFCIRPAGLHRHHQIYRVLDLHGHGKGGWTHYPVLSEVDLHQRGPSCQVIRRKTGKDQMDTHVFVSDPAGELPPKQQTLLADLLCSNGQLAEGLQVGDLRHAQAPAEHLSCRNISKVSPVAPVPMGEELRQRLVSHLALSRLDLASHQGLYESLRLYNPRALLDEQSRWAHRNILDGLLGVKSEEVSVTEPRELLPIRGRATELDLGEGAFDSEGDLYLFGSVLNELIALQTPVNWYSQFSIRWTKTKGLYQWPKRLGTKVLDV